MNLLLIFIPILFSISCASNRSVDLSQKGVFEISNFDEKIQLSNQEPIILNFFRIKDADFFVSNFKNIKSENFINFLSKRKSIFLNLFADDTEPYSGKFIEKSKCLKKVESESVEFLSGPEKNWSDCHAGNNEFPKSNAFRVWHFCRETAWEVTVKSSSLKNISFKCL